MRKFRFIQAAQLHVGGPRSYRTNDNIIKRLVWALVAHAIENMLQSCSDVGPIREIVDDYERFIQ